MKTMKRFGCLLLVLAMVLALGVSAFAANSTTTKGSIEIEDASAGETYSIYKIFELTYADDGSSYSYKLVDEWYDFFFNDLYYTEAHQYFTFIEVPASSDSGIAGQRDEDAEYYLDPNSEIFNMVDSSTLMKEFAQAAMAYVELHNITPTASAVAQHDGFYVGDDGERANVVFDDLALGWYLIDSSQGTLCMITNTDPDAVVNEKNGEPTISKYVIDEDYDESYDADGDGEDDETEDDADNGDRMEFKLVIENVANMSNLVIHDYMDEQFDIDSLVIENVILYTSSSDTEGTVLEHDSWVDPSFAVGGDSGGVTVKIGGECTAECGLEGCSFEIAIADSLLHDLDETAYIVVYYTVLLDEDFTDFDPDTLIDEMDNWAGVSYGNAGHAAPVETETYSFGFEIFKYTNATYDIIYETVSIPLAENMPPNVDAIDTDYYISYVDSYGTEWYVELAEGEDGFGYQVVDVVGTLVESCYLTTTTTASNLGSTQEFHIYGLDPSINYTVSYVERDGEVADVEWTDTKITAGDEIPLAGAQFVLSKTVNGVTYYAIFEEVEGVDASDRDKGFYVDEGSSPCYIFVGWTSNENSATVLTSQLEAIIIEGLRDGEYELTEVVAPDGYNKLDSPIEITITENGVVIVNSEIDHDKIVEVFNAEGFELPGTGGIGTTIFYVIGAILVCGAVVLLVTKRRTNNKGQAET